MDVGVVSRARHLQATVLSARGRLARCGHEQMELAKMAGTIERPLRRLARAADLVRNSPGRTVAAIPDFTITDTLEKHFVTDLASQRSE